MSPWPLVAIRLQLPGHALQGVAEPEKVLSTGPALITQEAAYRFRPAPHSDGVSALEARRGDPGFRDAEGRDRERAAPEVHEIDADQHDGRDADRGQRDEIVDLRIPGRAQRDICGARDHLIRRLSIRLSLVCQKTVYVGEAREDRPNRTDSPVEKEQMVGASAF